ncbi:MAG TPA: hypothetical protein VN032_09205 [Thermoanaerobaculia bacterium]|jgi:hypothetical protein|nr:hypothetical protein [Thermoanaerobaculia bacterium]
MNTVLRLLVAAGQIIVFALVMLGLADLALGGAAHRVQVRDVLALALAMTLQYGLECVRARHYGGTP